MGTKPCVKRFTASMIKTTGLLLISWPLILLSYPVNLAINYPAYLAPNYPQLQRLINHGETVQANFLAKAMLEIAEKTEDHTSQIFVLRVFDTTGIFDEAKHPWRKIYSVELDAVYDIEKQCHHILSAILRLNLNIALDSVVDRDKIDEVQERLSLALHKHPSCSLKLLAKMHYIYTLYIPRT